MPKGVRTRLTDSEPVGRFYRYVIACELIRASDTQRVLAMTGRSRDMDLVRVTDASKEWDSMQRRWEK